MLCCVCKEKDATVHLTQIAGDKMQKVDLCEECAKKKGVNDPTGFSLADLLLGLGASQEMEATAGADLKCPKCGFAQADFKKTGRLGCPDCYQVFSEGLESLLKSMHKGTQHVGKTPASQRDSRATQVEAKLLQDELTKAIVDEDFEKAAQLRDDLKRLSGKTGVTAKA